MNAQRRAVITYRVGERVRCAIATALDLDGLELRERLGTIVFAEPFPDDDEPGWLLGVVWDGVGQYLRIYHTGADVEAYVRVADDLEAA